MTPSIESAVKPRAVSHVIFDMDGLLIDSEIYYETGMRNVCARYGKDFTWDIKRQIMGTTGNITGKLVVDLLQLPITPQEFVDQVEAEYPKLFPLVQLMPGVERLLDHLTAHKVPIAIASSSKLKWFEVKTHKLGQRFRDYFHHILLAPEEPEVKNCKPAPDTFLVCMSRFPEPKPTPSDCLVFEDSVTGVMAAVRAGMQVVNIPDQRLDINEIKTLEPDFRPTLVLSSMEEFVPESFGLPPFPAAN